MLSDKLSLLYFIKNLASVSRHNDVSIKASKKVLRVLNVFYKEGFAYNNNKTKIFIKISGSKYKLVIKDIKVISSLNKFILVTLKNLLKLNKRGQLNSFQNLFIFIKNLKEKIIKFVGNIIK